MSCPRVGALCLIVSWLLVDVQPHRATDGASVIQSADASQIVARAFAAIDEYESTFRNLTAEETKTIEVFRASGELERRRQIVSDLLAYRSPRDGRVTTEYRDVRSVDGMPVPNRHERALKLLTHASNEPSLQKELEQINRETDRYEFHRHLRGFAIRQTSVLKLHPEAFRVEIAGREQIDGHDVIVLDYEQTGTVAGFQLALPKEFGDAPRRHRGRLWVDAETAQLWHEVWELVVPHPAAAEPLVLLRSERFYRPSPFGILVPRRIVFEWFTHFRHPKNAPPTFLLSERTTFTYEAFRRFDVTTEEKTGGR